MLAARPLRLALISSLALVGLVPAVAVSASAVEENSVVQVLPLTTTGGAVTDLAQLQEPQEGPSSPAGVSGGSGAALGRSEVLNSITTVDPAADATLLTNPLEVKDFLVAGFTWQGSAELPTGTQIYLRVRENGQWSDWFLNDASVSGPDSGAAVSGTDEFVTGGADAIQAAVVTPDGQLPKGLSLSLVPGTPKRTETLDVNDVEKVQAGKTAVASDGSSESDVAAQSTADAGANASSSTTVQSVDEVPAGTTSGTAVNPTAATLLAATTTANGLPVPVTTRSEWGAKSSYMTWDPEYVAADHVIVHHTAGTNDYTASQSASIVSGIYYYHAVTLGWGDIGYNFLVDKYGQVFEGRYGTLQAAAGKMVVGGHALGANTGTLGISMMGNFVSQSPTDMQLDRVGKLAGWFLKRAGVTNANESANFTIHTTTKYKAGQVVALPRIMGHRDVNYTECPGDAGYAKLSTIRSIAQSVIAGSANPSTSSGWKAENGSWYYYKGDGTRATGWLRDNNFWYYLAADGRMQTGWLKLNGLWYYLNTSGQMLTGWATIDGARYYFTSSGAMATGDITIDGVKYRLADSGKAVTGWRQSAVGQWYYFDSNGAMLTGWQTISGSRYYFATSGSMATGWLNVSDAWYYLSSSGAAVKGWQTIGGIRYLFKSDYAMATGWAQSGSYWYYFEASGALGTPGWHLLNGKWFYLDANGATPTGWQRIAGSWYYFDTSTHLMATGWTKAGNDWYYMDSSGHYQTGWISVDGYRSYLGTNGIALTGWYLERKKWYYFNQNRQLVQGWFQVGKTWYYADPSGVMQTGWLQLGASKYYLQSSGAMFTGWLKENSTSYYFAPNGVMQTGWFQADGNWYYADASGIVQTGWRNLSGVWYYFQKSGVMVTNWLQIDGAWYFFNARGAMQRGWFQVGTTWYYADASGAMQTGWLNLGGTWYYLAPSGAMLTGVQLIDGRYSQFSASGAWLGYTSEPVTQSLHTVMAAPTASRSVLISKMVAAFKKSGQTYPSAALGKGGASTIDAFAGLIYDEATAEGVSPELLYVQVMKETGWLQFGGDVKISQFNFGGLGATGNGVAGASFASVQIGLRAQVQHLRAYGDASVTESKLAHAVVDERFKYVKKGSAKYIEYLGIQENPDHLGWAAAKNYGYALVDLMKKYFA